MAFSKECVSSATFVVRARGLAAAAASAKRYLPTFPDIRHIALRLPSHISTASFGKSEHAAMLSLLPTLTEYAEVSHVAIFLS